jgi:hypothetical protein
MTEIFFNGIANIHNIFLVIVLIKHLVKNDQYLSKALDVFFDFSL